MSATRGESGEVRGMATSLQEILKDIIDANKKGDSLISELGQTSKDGSLKVAKSVVDEVASVVLANAKACGETARNLAAYAKFLGELEEDG